MELTGTSIQPDALRYQRSIDSHFSLGQNMINFRIINEVANRSIAAKDDPTFPNLKSYYNAITEVYECFFFIFPKDRLRDFEKKSAQFNALYEAVLDGKAPMTYRTSAKMLFILKNMRYIVTSTLQHLFSYFYRMSTRQKRGLNNLDFMLEENIFK
jgi:hypothetical protein